MGSEVDVNVGNAWETVNEMVNGFFAILPNLVIGLVVLVLFFFLAKGVRYLIRRGVSQYADHLGVVLGRLAQAVVILLGFLVAVAIIAPSVKPVDFLSALGVSSIAIGFAFKDILQNLLAGILILLQRPFEVGDQIIFESYEGTVEAIQARATILKTYDGRQVLVPNGEIYTNSVVVNTAYEALRNQYDVGIGYGDDMEKAEEAMLEAMRNVEGVLSDPAPDVITVELAGSSVNLRARWWTDPHRADVMKTQHKVIRAIKQALDDAAIDMPYPTRVVLWHDQTEEIDGDRTKQREGWPVGDNPPQPQKIAQTLQEQQGARKQQATANPNGNGSNN